MDTVLVQIENSEAYRLLKNLEKLHLIKLLHKKRPLKQVLLSQKYAGKLSASDAEKLQEYVSQSRSEWDR